MTDRDETKAKILALIEPFNKKGVEVGEGTRFAQDLEWDSLTVLDFVANIEDEFDILITMNQQGGSILMDNALMKLAAEGKISREEAEKRSKSKTAAINY